MLKLSRWKVTLVALAALFGVVFALPNMLPASAVARLPGALQQRLNLGLDLQGGSYLLYEVDTDALKTQRLTNVTEDARRALAVDGIGFTGLGAANGQVQVRINDPGQVDRAQSELDKLALPLQGAIGGKDLQVLKGADQTLLLRPATEAATAGASKAVDQTIEVIRRRIDQLGTREPTILKQGTNRILVEAPGESDPERLKAVIGKTAKLSFQMVDDSAGPPTPGQEPPPGDAIVKSNDGAVPAYVLQRRVLVSGEDLVTASQAFDQNNAPAVAFRFNSRGARVFAETTANNIGKRFAIVLDDAVISAPRIDGVIPGGSGQITGNFTQQSATDLALLLRSGALPAPLKVVEQRTVTAELGADAVKAGAISLGIGALAIIVFIVLAYGLFGVFAAVALVVNVLMLVATLSVTQATLTLPGVAGLILTLAVAVDANVLIYERMRDEARAGRTPLLAADNGFRRALVSIIDANVTTLISAAIMFQFGSGPVRGFAWTLSVGVLTSLFTAIFITQVLIGWWFRAAKPKTLPI